VKQAEDNRYGAKSQIKYGDIVEIYHRLPSPMGLQRESWYQAQSQKDNVSKRSSFIEQTVADCLKRALGSIYTAIFK
jgi:hypothetical protein